MTPTLTAYGGLPTSATADLGLNTALRGTLGVAALLFLLFAVQYGLRALWWKDSVGRISLIKETLLGLGAGAAALLIRAIQWNSPLAGWSFCAVLWLVNAALAVKIVVFVKISRENPRGGWVVRALQWYITEPGRDWVTRPIKTWRLSSRRRQSRRRLSRAGDGSTSLCQQPAPDQSR